MKFLDIKNVILGIEKEYSVEKKNIIMNLVNNLKEDNRKNVQGLSDRILKFIQKNDEEINRVMKMYDFDSSFGKYNYLAGVDEVGRGPLAGPIVAASVVLNLDYNNDKDLILGIKDSKKLTAKSREELSEIIKSKALYYNIVEIDNNQIDNKGIAWCNNEVLKRAAINLPIRPDMVLSDGYAVKGIGLKNEFIIKGDSKSASIACASIIAKVYRDKKMEEYSKLYTYYGFEKNAGYGTAEHIEGLKKYGPSPLHRTSFLKNILSNIL
ncbi:ribonuclease HII [Clostridium lundense]|uniref:ribonuclease HII n=1 Tax=Clostridium lundense TaxID=319475 RepID=UPI000558A940|nr:ribonuclease HII [Clostridium lundense]